LSSEVEPEISFVPQSALESVYKSEVNGENPSVYVSEYQSDYYVENTGDEIVEVSEVYQSELIHGDGVTQHRESISKSRIYLRDQADETEAVKAIKPAK
jgi:hypothetical protein